ncbi:MraY family glycosyltransferase [Halochromatium glycolicum]|nr:MraY family glycosyltransferase [Halochromatium glycolicum]
MALIPPLVRIARPLGMVDAGGGRKVHEGSVPRIGGVAIFVGFLVSVLFWVPMEQGIEVFLAAVAVLFVFGLLDDRFNLDYRLKLLGQLLAAGIVIFGADVLIQRLAFWPGGLLPEWIAIPLTLLVLAGVTNAVNLSDGLDGLAGGIGLLAVSGLLVLGVESDAGALLIVLGSLLGAILGFLRFNTFPAQLFMGDAGSQLLGFSIGVLAVIITQRPSAELSPVLPLLVLGLPILDMLTVMIGRIARGRSPFKADRTHLHHRLLAAGMSQSEAVSLIYGLQFLLILVAYLLRHAADGLIFVTALSVGGLLLIGLRSVERHRAELRNRTRQQQPFTRFAGWLRRKGLLRVSLTGLSIGLPLFLLFGTLAAPAVGPDIGVLAAVLGGTLAFILQTKRVPFFALERLSSYTLALGVAYLLAGSPLETACPACITLIYGALAAAAAVCVWRSSEGFHVNSLDLLILLGALVAPTLHGLGLADLGALVLHAIILFYGIEILMHVEGRRWDWLRIATLIGLAVLAVRGLLLV